MFELKNWCIEKAMDDYYVHGNVYNNPKFANGQFIHTSPLLRVEEHADEYIAYTFNSEYLLRKNTHKKNKHFEKDIDQMSAQYQQAFSCAEKILSVGDSLYYCFSLYYRTEKGVIRLEPKKMDSADILFEYAADGFKMRASISGEFFVEDAAEDTDNALYKLSLQPNRLEKKDYRLIRYKNELNEIFGR